jgi:hypothetical protein
MSTALERPLVLRWTIGDVSDEGFEALRLSIWGARRVFGGDAHHVVCVNTISIDEACERTGALPSGVEWHDSTGEIPGFLERHLDRNMAEGVGWKFAPLKMYDDRYVLALDNDCILWRMPDAVRAWLETGEGCVIAEDVRPCFGQFAPVLGPEPRNSGIRGIPPGFDLEAMLRVVLDDYPVTLTTELDEQGLQVAALARAGDPRVVRVSEVTICSPFPPHIPGVGTCGVHCVGLNSKHLPWSYEGRPAVEHIREHWRKLRPGIYDRVGAPLEVGC